MFDEVAQAELAELEIVQTPTQNLWIIHEDQARVAERNGIDSELAAQIYEDMAGAMEGDSEERRSNARKRAAGLAKDFILERKRTNRLWCDDCEFDPQNVADIPAASRRSCLDVHHKHPLAEGVRLTTLEDFALLCPTCHRLEHVRLRVNKSR